MARRTMSSHPGAKTKLEQMGALAAGLAHELKNPLSTMGINLSLLKEDWADASTPRERRTLKKIEVLEREVRRLELILQEFLQYARGFELEKKSTDLNGRLTELLEFIEPEARRENIAIRSMFDARVPRIPLDRGLIRRAFLNLFINARQAMQEGGGELIVITRCVDDEVQVEVIDTGKGMPEEIRERAFDVYYSTKKGGTGLGLPMVKRIVEAHEGRITVQTEVGHGTRFVVHLPVAPPDGEVAREDDEVPS